MAKVLILEQSKSVRNNLRERLEFEGYSTEAAETLDIAKESYKTMPFDIILSDNVTDIRDTGIPFIVLSTDNTIESAVKALQHGADDFITKPIDMNRLLNAIKRISDDSSFKQIHNHNENKHCQKRKASSCIIDIEPIIGESDGITHVKNLIDKVAASDARVLITGENGTGKELVARWLHHKSKRAGAPFIEVNCAAIPSELIESELFGHERGAFTSAIKQRKGKFEQADGGTLFLDEIGDMSLSAQAKVLRALQERKISRVGSDRDIAVNVRVIAATNKDLRTEIRNGNFREDLYHRIGVIVIKVPPLRERSDDIPMLADYFMRKICFENNINCKDIDREAIDALVQMSWSGNIRELRNVMERLIILAEERITLHDVISYC